MGSGEDNKEMGGEQGDVNYLEETYLVKNTALASIFADSADIEENQRHLRYLRETIARITYFLPLPIIAIRTRNIYQK